MPIHMNTTTTVAHLTIGDTVEGIGTVQTIRRLNRNADVKFIDIDKPRRWSLDKEVIIVRAVQTWQEKLSAAADHLGHHTDGIMLYVEDAMACSTRIKWAEKLATGNTNEMLRTLSWDNEAMLIELQVEVKLQYLGRLIENRKEGDEFHEIIAQFLDTMTEDLVDWRPGRSTSLSSNLVDDAERAAMRYIVKEMNEVANFRFALARLNKIIAALPQDTSLPFDPNAIDN